MFIFDMETIKELRHEGMWACDWDGTLLVCFYRPLNNKDHKIFNSKLDLSKRNFNHNSNNHKYHNKLWYNPQFRVFK